MFVGNKAESAQDYADANGYLSFTRYYSSFGARPIPGRAALGTLWMHGFQGYLTVAELATGRILRLNRPTGNSYVFRQVGADWVPDPDVQERVTEILIGTTLVGWRVALPDNKVEQYDVSGRLERIEHTNGGVVQLGYDSYGRLSTISDLSGRALILSYSGSVLEKIKLPDGRLVKYAYDAQRLSTVSYQIDDAATPQFASVQYKYEDSHNSKLLTGRVDEAGQRYATWQYYADGRAKSSQHGNPTDGIDLVTVVYGSDRSWVTNALGETVESGFVRQLGRAKVSWTQKPCSSCGGSSAQARSYDANGYPDVLTDFAGVTTDFDYSARGLVTQQIDSANNAATKRTLNTDWHPSFNLPTERRTYDAADVLVAKQTWTHNARGQVLTTTGTDPIAGATRTATTTYCEQADITSGTCPLLGLVTSIDGLRTDVNDTTTYTYYPSDDATCATSPTTCPHRKGDLWLVQDALGNITETLKYDGAGRVLSMKDANGVVTDFEYHPRGWLTARKVRGTDNASEADDQITRIDYYPTGLVQKTMLPDGSYTSYTYDAAHRLTDITDGDGNKIHYTLDNAGNSTKEETLGTTGSVLRTLSRVYNQLGQLQTHKDAYDHGTGYVYDANGNTDTVTDALSRVTDNDYDPLNRLTKTIQNVGGLNVTTQFKYDARDNLTEVIDPKSLSTKYTYNSLGDLTKLESPDTGTTDYTYDSAGNRKTQLDARGVTATYGYDALNRLVSVSYPDSSLNVGYGYDTAGAACVSGETFAAGRLSQVTDGSGGTQYCYDRFGQMVRKVQTTAGQSLAVRYAYTKAGQLSSVTYPDGSVADYVRDSLGRTTQVGVTRPGGSRQILLTSASYYPFGPASEWTFGNGRLFQRTLNQNYQPGVIQDASSGGLSLGYEFDPVGNLVKLRNGNQNDPPLRLYGYDALNRLTSAQDGTTQSFTEGYTYDATGNRTSATVGSTTTAYTLAQASHRLTDVGGVARLYDNVGNTLSIGARGFAYNDANRMNQVVNGTATVSYAYNGKGEQVRRSNGTSDTVTVYDEAGHWLGEYDSAGVPNQQVVWLDDLPVGLIVGAVAANQPLYYIEADALGTPRAVIEAQRDVAVWSWPLTGEAFGVDQPIADVDGDGTSLSFNLRFPGQRYDAATQLNYNYFRDYEATTGRYVESDPIGLGGGLSTYSYVDGNSLNATDPTGLLVESEAAIEAAVKRALAVEAAGGGPLDPAADVLAIGVLVGTLVVEECAKNDDLCRRLVGQIWWYTNEINGRLTDMMMDHLNLFRLAPYAPSPSLPKGSGSWRGHGMKIDELQRGLKKKISDAIRMKCKVPQAAWEAAYAKIPSRPERKK